VAGTWSLVISVLTSFGAGALAKTVLDEYLQNRQARGAALWARDQEDFKTVRKEAAALAATARSAPDVLSALGRLDNRWLERRWNRCVKAWGRVANAEAPKPNTEVAPAVRKRSKANRKEQRFLDHLSRLERRRAAAVMRATRREEAAKH
jgi:hypothetical protein